MSRLSETLRSRSESLRGEGNTKLYLYRTLASKASSDKDKAFEARRNGDFGLADHLDLQSMRSESQANEAKAEATRLLAQAADFLKQAEAADVD